MFRQVPPPKHHLQSKYPLILDVLDVSLVGAHPFCPKCVEKVAEEFPQCPFFVVIIFASSINPSDDWQFSPGYGISTRMLSWQSTAVCTKLTALRLWPALAIFPAPSSLLSRRSWTSSSVSATARVALHLSFVISYLQTHEFL